VLSAAKPGREPGSDRESLSQRTGGDLDARALQAVRVALEDRAELAQGAQVVAAEVARLGQCRVQHGGGVSLGEDEAVAR